VVELLVSSSVTEAETSALWAVYDAVFGDIDEKTWREVVWDLHRARDGFTWVQARVEGALVGFAYGYTGDHGQWWTEHARRALAPAVAGEWLGGHFEVVSIGTLSRDRGGELERQLLRALTDDVPHDRLLLMTTADQDDPARHLYVSEGWQVVGPGIGDEQVIMGKRRARP
jgi:ribosomal protein S18 acetylase RimI-like enzyme